MKTVESKTEPNRTGTKWGGKKKQKQQNKKDQVVANSYQTCQNRFLLNVYFLLLTFARCFVCCFFFFCSDSRENIQGSEPEWLIGRLTHLFRVHLQLKTTQRDKRRRRRLAGVKISFFWFSPPMLFSLCEMCQTEEEKGAEGESTPGIASLYLRAGD